MNIQVNGTVCYDITCFTLPFSFKHYYQCIFNVWVVHYFTTAGSYYTVWCAHCWSRMVTKSCLLLRYWSRVYSCIIGKHITSSYLYMLYILSCSLSFLLLIVSFLLLFLLTVLSYLTISLTVGYLRNKFSNAETNDKYIISG